MTKPQSLLTPPEAPPTRSREEVFDTENFPASQSDLEHRPAWPDESQDQFRGVVWFIFVAAIAFPVSFLFRWGFGQSLCNLESFLAATGLGCVAGLVFLHQTKQASPAKAVGVCLIPIWAWATLSLSSQVGTESGCWTFFLIGVVPITAFAFDSIGTHAVFWISANANLAIGTKLAHRASWAVRFSHAAPSDVRSAYQHGSILTILCVALGIGCGLTFFDAPMFRVKTLLLTVAILLATAIIRCGFDLFAMVRAWRLLLHWFWYGSGRQFPPYVFQSPTGPAWARQAVLTTSILLWAIGILALTEYAELRFTLETLRKGHWLLSLVEFFKQLFLLFVWPTLLIAISWGAAFTALVAPIISNYHSQIEDKHESNHATNIPA